MSKVSIGIAAAFMVTLAVAAVSMAQEDLKAEKKQAEEADGLVIEQVCSGFPGTEGNKKKSKQKVIIKGNNIYMQNLETLDICIVRGDKKLIWEIDAERKEYRDRKFEYFAKLKAENIKKRKELAKIINKMPDPRARKKHAEKNRFLVDEKVMAADLQQLEGGAFRYRMVLEARVVPVRGERDPSLRLDLEVNERLLQAGDELVVRARANRDGYIYLFDFLSDNTVMLIFPNAMMTDNSVSAGEWLEIPTQQERARGLHYRVAGDPDAPTTNETVYAVFTRQPIADLSGLMSVPEGYVSFSAGDDSFTDFQRWLVEIPLSQRVERAIQLHILSE